jgi:nucleotide-binding universal stress UspA family protein
MKYFKDILVVYDSKTDNRALFERAVELGQRNQARLTVVNLVEEVPRKGADAVRRETAAESPGPGIDIIEEFPHEVRAGAPMRPSVGAQQRDTGQKLSLDVQEHIIQAEKPNLEEFVTEMRRAGVQASGKMLRGTPFVEIIREVLRNRHDLVMMTAEDGGRLKRVLFGSTIMDLIRKCPCPVWVIKPEYVRKHGPILAAVDVMPADTERNALSDRIMDIAISLARFDQSELITIHTWTMYGESVLRSRRSMLHKEEVDELVAETRDTHRQALTELLRRHSLENLKYQVYMLKGDAYTLIPELATKKQVELIVIGTVSRGGIAGLLIGHTAEKVLHRVDCSVLTVKPEGFVTPVKPDAA